jgi:hypothetical protein
VAFAESKAAGVPPAAETDLFMEKDQLLITTGGALKTSL